LPLTCPLVGRLLADDPVDGLRVGGMVDEGLRTVDGTNLPVER
jgi:hypothetical protein